MSLRPAAIAGVGIGVAAGTAYAVNAAPSLLALSWIGSVVEGQRDVAGRTDPGEAGRSATHCAVGLLKAHDVLCAPVRSFAECIAHPQAAHLGTFEPVQQPETGLLALPGTPVRSMRRAMAPAPKLGEHTATVLQASGFGSDELARWRAAGVLVQA